MSRPFSGEHRLVVDTVKRAVRTGSNGRDAVALG